MRVNINYNNNKDSTVVDISEAKLLGCFNTIPEVRYLDYLYYIPKLDICMMVLPYAPFDSSEMLANYDGWLDSEVVEVLETGPDITNYLLKLGRPDMVSPVLRCLLDFLKNN